MKIRLIAAITLLAICLGAALFCVFYTSYRAKELTQSLESALEAAITLSGDWESVTEQALQIWKRDKNFYHIILPHVNLNELEWALWSLPQYLEQRDSTLFIEQCVRSIQCVKTIREMEIPNWGNIF